MIVLVGNLPVVSLLLDNSACSRVLLSTEIGLMSSYTVNVGTGPGSTELCNTNGSCLTGSVWLTSELTGRLNVVWLVLICLCFCYR